MTPINAHSVNVFNAYSANPDRQHSCMGKKPESEPSPFWERLTSAWGAKGLPTTQNGVAKRLDMSQGSTRRWYTGDGFPETKALVEIATKGNVTIDWLLTGRLPRAPVQSGDPLERLLQIWEQLDIQARQHLQRAAEGQLAVSREGAAQPEPKKSHTRRVA